MLHGDEWSVNCCEPTTGTRWRIHDVIIYISNDEIGELGLNIVSQNSGAPGEHLKTDQISLCWDVHPTIFWLIMTHSHICLRMSPT